MQLAADPNIDNLGLAIGNTGAPAQGRTEATGAYAIYNHDYIFQDRGEAYTVFIGCIPLILGEAVLAVVQNVPAEDFNDQIEAREGLLRGLRLPGAAPESMTATVVSSERPTSAPTATSRSAATGATTAVPASATSAPPASTAIPETNDDQACTNAVRQVATLFPLTFEGLELFTGCRRATAGMWFLPTGPDDPRLPGGPPLDPTERELVAPLRRQIEAQLAALNADLAATADLVAASGGSLGNGLEGVRPQLSPPWREFVFERGGHFLRNAYQQIYAPIFDSHAIDPENAALGDYAKWWLNRRTAEAARVETYIETRDPIMREALLDVFGSARRPWPWELADPLTMEEHLAWALANGRVPGTTQRRRPTRERRHARTDL